MAYVEVSPAAVLRSLGERASAERARECTELGSDVHHGEGDRAPAPRYDLVSGPIIGTGGDTNLRRDGVSQWHGSEAETDQDLRHDDSVNVVGTRCDSGTDEGNSACDD